MKLHFSKLAEHGYADPTKTANFVLAQTEGHIDVTDGENVDILACPYSVFSLEPSSGHLTHLVNVDNHGEKAVLLCIHCVEKKPGSYKFTMLTGDNAVIKVGHEDEAFKSTYNDMLIIVDSLLSVINNGSKAIVKGVKKIPYKRGKKKVKYKPSTVIYVQGKNQHQSSKLPDGTTLEWDHSWPVRAHWRRLHNPESFGKDRKGQHTMKGWTWVMNYIKGEGPLQRKPYKVI